MLFDREKSLLIDLTLPICPFKKDLVGFTKVTRFNHTEGARLNSVPAGIDAKDFPEGKCQGWEEVTLVTHVGTHLDSPWHFSPTSEGKPSKSIGEVPLDWCIGNGVILDLTNKEPEGLITKEDIIHSLKDINYTIKPYDIVLIRTDYDKKWETYVDYFEKHPGMGRESTIYLLDQGVKVIGIDTLGFDRPFKKMGELFRKTHNKDVLWPAHNVGKEREYCHYERLANLWKVPVPFGFTFVGAPVIVEGASAGWTRAFAIVEKDKT